MARRKPGNCSGLLLGGLIPSPFTGFDLLDGCFFSGQNFLVLLGGELVGVSLIEVGNGSPTGLAGVGDADFLLSVG